jgi:hypothetical protein
MSEYDNDMRGVLFKNDRKEKDTHPDYKGQCEIGGVEFWLSAWIKEGKKGKFMSLSIQAKDDKPVKKAIPKAGRDDRDSVPF